MAPKLRVLELFSGIGGMHWALKKSGVEYEVVMAVDINTTTNRIYQHNFPSTNLKSFGLEKLTIHQLESFSVNAILMSPPCQPFTRVGKRGDYKDVRTKSFLHILQLLQQIKTKPTYILVENVKGFETSQTRQAMTECLKDCDYSYQEFFLTPLQFEIPNCRLRYYLIAKLKGSFAFEVQPEIMTDLPKAVMLPLVTDDIFCKEVPNCSTVKTVISTNNQSATSKHAADIFNHIIESTQNSESVYSNRFSNERSCLSHCSAAQATQSKPENLEDINRISSELSALKDAGHNMRYCEENDDFITESSRQLSDFMEFGSFDEFKDYWLTEKEMRLFVIMDIVFPSLKKSTCFTKRYGHYIDGAGSVVHMTSDVEDVRTASKLKAEAVKLKNRSQWSDTELNIIKKLKLRYFTPREVANLMCFPPEFDFPTGLSPQQKYRALGNSVNVFVVSQLIKLMVHETKTLHTT